MNDLGEFGSLITLLGSLSRGDRKSDPDLFRILGLREGHTDPAEIPAERWRVLLQRIPLDERSFFNVFSPEVKPEVLIAGLSTWCKQYREGPESYRSTHRLVFAFAGLFLLTWRGLRESERQRSAFDAVSPGASAGEGNPQSHVCECGKHDEHELLKQEPVQWAIEAVYRPAVSAEAPTAEEAEWKEWKVLKSHFKQLEFHRHGTTSLIVRCPTGRREAAALKLILLPYTTINTITNATRNYYSDYNPSNSAHRGLVDVWASTESWISMEFVDGLTLAELFARPALLKRKLENPDDDLTKVLTQLIDGEPDGEESAELPSAPSRKKSLDVLLGDYDKCEQAPAERPDKELLTLDIDRLDVLGNALFRALDTLRDVGRAKVAQHSSSPAASSELAGVHGDLTPSNIIVRNDRSIDFTLVDLGRNYLYTHSVTGHAGTDSRYAAPEVRRGAKQIQLADLYSVGHLLIDFGGFPDHGEGIVPDAFYARTPLMARFIEDLIQREPNQRLLIFAGVAERQGFHYRQLLKHFRGELKAVRAADKDPVAQDASRLRLINDLRHPAAKTPGRLWRLRRIRKQQGPRLGGQQGRSLRLRGLPRLVAKTPGRLWSLRPKGRRKRTLRGGAQEGYVQWLFWWSLISAVAGFLTMAVVIMWTLRDAGLSWDNLDIDLTRRATGSGSTGYPYLDDLRRSGYRVPNFPANWPARIIGYSYVLIGARYYQAIFAGVTPLLGRHAKRLRSVGFTAEFTMRLMAVVPAVLVLTATLVEAWWWPLCSAIGQTFLFFNNWAARRFEHAAFSQARKLGISTVASDDRRITGLESFDQWTPSSLFYAITVWLLGSLIYVGFLRDPIYAFSVAGVNIGLFYLVKCGTGAPEIRIALTRACLAAERVDLVGRGEPTRA